MKYILFTLFIISNAVFSQTVKFPDGVYLSLEELNNKKPSFNTNLVVEKRSNKEMIWNGGNQFKLISKNDSLSKRYIKKRIYCYIKNDSIFVNGRQQGIHNYYVLSRTSGKFLVFQSGQAITNKANNIAMAGAMFGIAGALVATAIVSSSDEDYDKSKFWYVLSLRTGNCKEFDKGYIFGRLEDYPKMLDQFKADPENSSYLTWFKYINFVNQSLN